MSRELFEAIPMGECDQLSGSGLFRADDEMWQKIAGRPRYIFLRERAVGYRSVNIYRDEHLGVEVVAKGWQLEWVRREGRLSGVDHHPNIVSIYGLAVDSMGQFYLISEYLRNGTLEVWLKGKHDMGEVGLVVDQLASALSHIHENRRQIYADMKPANVIFGEDWRPKLIDFDISYSMVEGRANNKLLWGTPSHEAPEQNREGQLDHRVDIYSLAATIYSILVNEDRAPEHRIKFESHAYDMEDIRPHFRNQLDVERVAAVSRVIRKALSYWPGDRHQSVSDFNREFQTALSS